LSGFKAFKRQSKPELHPIRLAYERLLRMSVSEHSLVLIACILTFIQQIHANPEIAFEESIAHDTLCDFLEGLGFEVNRKAFGIETAFEVRFGQGGRLINIDAEYDALPRVCHGCGHHLIAATRLAVFLGIVRAIKEQDIPGRVQLLGCLAEENQGDKVVPVRNGTLNGVDAAIEALFFFSSLPSENSNP
jgi:metal-dependent amidase/aminoacylase/carboxypeptidase family protein